MPLVMSARAKRFMSMPAIAKGFSDRVDQYEADAAVEATEMSRAMSRRFTSGRPLAPPRPGRPTTEGAFANYLQWQRGTNGMIEFDLPALASAAPYWLIQEIGTGRTAQILGASGGGTATVRSQIGRRISASLYWSDAEGAVPIRPMSKKKRLEAIEGHFPMGVHQQLYPISSIMNGAYIPRAQGRSGIIRKEIRGKHFIQDGGISGFRFLRDEILADARRTFR